jgi:hypothetical protein
LTCDFWAENAKKYKDKSKGNRISRFAPAFGRAVAPCGLAFYCTRERVPSILALAFGRVVGLSRWTLVSFAERDFEGVYFFSVADAFELAIKLGGGIDGVAIFVLIFGFGLALLESMVEIGLGERVERDESEAESGCGGIKPAMVRIGGFFSAVPKTLEKKYGGEERERG